MAGSLTCVLHEHCGLVLEVTPDTGKFEKLVARNMELERAAEGADAALAEATAMKVGAQTVQSQPLCVFFFFAKTQDACFPSRTAD